MNMYPELTPEERGNRLRLAERRIYDQLAATDHAGRTIYEVRPHLQAPQLDFWTIFQDVAHFGLQIKGGSYQLDDNGDWYLLGPGGPERTASPLRQTWAATMALHDALYERLGRKVFLIPVCAFPDMTQGRSIEALAIQAKVHIVWGYTELVDDLLGFSHEHTIFQLPTAESTAEEVAAIMPEVQRNRPVAPVAAEAVDLNTRQVIIQHADTVNVYTTGWDTAAGDDHLELPTTR